MKSAEEQFGSKSADAGSRDLDFMSFARSTPNFSPAAVSFLLSDDAASSAMRAVARA